MSFWITDYIKNPTIEESVIGTKILSESQKFDAKVLLVWHQKINSDFIKNFKDLKGIVRYGVGFDNIDIDLLAKRKIIFCNNPDYGVDEVADTASAMILNFVRGINQYNLVAKKIPPSWQENTNKKIKRLNKVRLGVVGAGRIGSSVIKKLKSFKFDISFYDPYLPSGYEKVLNVKRTKTLKGLLKHSDVVSLHCPLNLETKGMINQDFIDGCKKGVILVNTARGKLIESTNLLFKNLENKKIHAIGLDVLPEEPPIIDDFVDAWKRELFGGRVIINPHSAYYSKESYVEMRKNAAEKALAILQNRIPTDIIS
jgi:C-terminal binding protein